MLEAPGDHRLVLESPMSGEVVEVNTAAIEAPRDVLHAEAGTSGWLIELDLFLDDTDDGDSAELQWAELLMPDFKHAGARI